MPQNHRNRQKALERQKAKRKEKARRESARPVRPPAPRENDDLRRAAGWELQDCLVSQGWQSEGERMHILVARKGPSGRVAAAYFLVDLGLLGVRDADSRIYPSYDEYERVLLRPLLDTAIMEEADLNLVAKILGESIAYARKYDFSPHFDYHEAALLLAGAKPDECATAIPLGKDGQPFYVAGPRDNAAFIIAKLEKVAGPGNFKVVPLVAPGSWEDELDDEDEADPGREE